MNSTVRNTGPAAVTDNSATTVATGITFGHSTSSVGMATFTVQGPSKGSIGTGHTAKNVENAVYGHLRVMRTLGRTRVDSSEISQALQLPRHLIEQALNNLTKKGVKIVG